MTATYTGAIDAIFSLFLAHWTFNAPGVVGYVPELRWPGDSNAAPADSSRFWGRVSQQTVEQRQTSFATNVDGEGRRYRTTGLVYLQLFCPATVDGVVHGRELADVARSAFKGRATTNGVAFNNVAIQEPPPENGRFRLNVVAQYEYDEIS